MDGTLLRLYPATSLPAPLTPEARTEATELFRQSLSLLWRYRERILSDSRMFLIPIAETNGLAYLGTFPEATLGAYIELWMQCDAALITDERGIQHFVTRVAGSPLSGSNRCTLVSEEGEVSTRSVRDFSSLWRPLRGLIRRYRKPPSITPSPKSLPSSAKKARAVLPIPIHEGGEVTYIGDCCIESYLYLEC